MMYESLEAFYAEDGRRRFSAEWDYGVGWVDAEEQRWPCWRVSWVVETGELYAVRLASPCVVKVLGVVPPEGAYPYSASIETWWEWKDAQLVERVMDGWADEPHRPLAWVEQRLAALREEAAA